MIMKGKIPIYKIEALPVLQNKVYPTRRSAEESAVGDINLVQNSMTGVVENIAYNPSIVQYDDTYQNEQGVSKAFGEHLHEVKGIVRSFLGVESLVEIGCGKGFFLNMLRLSGVNIRGIDATYEGSDPYITKAMYKAGIGIHGRGIVLRHVLEHIPQPEQFLETISKENGSGRVYIEVPCLDWILKHQAWFDIFYEHVNYFRLEDFNRLFTSIKSSGHLFGGQYFYVVAELGALRANSEMYKYSSNSISIPETFLQVFTAQMHFLKSLSGKIVIWGASSKGVIFSLLAKRRGVEIDYIVDINPAKQGGYTPVTGLEVSPPEVLKADADDLNIIVMNSNYFDEIYGLMGSRCNYLLVDKDEFRATSKK